MIGRATVIMIVIMKAFRAHGPFCFHDPLWLHDQPSGGPPAQSMIMKRDRVMKPNGRIRPRNLHDHDHDHGVLGGRPRRSPDPHP
jgi:hypothetical protein